MTGRLPSLSVVISKEALSSFIALDSHFAFLSSGCAPKHLFSAGARKVFLPDPPTHGISGIVPLRTVWCVYGLTSFVLATTGTAGVPAC